MPDGIAGTEVLIVGAGPVGLVAALELARLGRSVRLIDAAAGPATSSRALGVHARTQELLDRLGLLEEFRAVSAPVAAFSVHASGHRLARLVLDLSPTPTVIGESRFLAQVDTEALLRRALADHGVTPEWGSRVVDVCRSPDAVTAVVERSDGTTTELSASYLVGADGGRSTIRKLAGLRMEGASDETWLVADATVAWDLPADSIHLLRTPGGTVVAFPFPERGRWRLLDTTETSQVDAGAMARRFADKLSSGLRRPVAVTDITWSSEFTIQQRSVGTLRSGRILLAGDAAHVHSPASGQGMNSGIQDAVNLGWKLAACLDGAADSLLDTYTEERRPVSAELLRSAAVATRLLQARSAAIRIGTRIALPPLRLIPPLKRRVDRRAAQAFSALSIRYSRSSIVHDDVAGQLPGPRPGERVTRYNGADPRGEAIRRALRTPGWLLIRRSDVKAEPPAGVTTLELDGWPRGWAADMTWYLVRPDSVVAARGTHADVPSEVFEGLPVVKSLARPQPHEVAPSEGSADR